LGFVWLDDLGLLFLLYCLSAGTGDLELLSLPAIMVLLPYPDPGPLLSAPMVLEGEGVTAGRGSLLIS